MVKLYEPSGGILDICSATLLAPRQMHSAGHCFRGDRLDSEGRLIPKSEVVCPNGFRTKIQKVTLASNYNEKKARQDDIERRFDSALVHLESAVDLPGIKFLKEKDSVVSLMERAAECAVFGYGGNARSGPDSEKLKGTKVDPATIEILSSGLLYVKGIGGWNSGLVQEGDSGGSLSCRDSNGVWNHLANISAMDFSYRSLLAPLFLSAELVAGLPQKETELARENEVAASLAFHRAEVTAQFRSIEAVLSRVDPSRAHFLREGISKSLSTKKEAEEWMKRVKEERGAVLAKSLGKVMRVLPFTRVQLDLADFELESPEFLAEFRSEKNPFSIADQSVNHFLLEKIDGTEAVGRLQIFGSSEYFAYEGCRHNIVCTPGIFRNVRVPVDRLDLSPLR